MTTLRTDLRAFLAAVEAMHEEQLRRYLDEERRGRGEVGDEE